MIKNTPFHARTSEANQSGLWSHWSGYLAADRYQTADKFEYFAIRNSAGVFDTSPLYKYRFTGKDAERFLAGVLTRDVRKCRPGQAQYTVWCNDEGWVLEDGVVFRHSGDEFLLTAARPNLAYFSDLADGYSVTIEDVSEDYGALAVQGPSSRRILTEVAPEVDELGFFRLAPVKIGDIAVTVSRTGYTGDLGYEIWVDADRALTVWDRLFEVGNAHGMIPVGQNAVLITRIEAGLVLIDVDFQSARYGWNDDQRVSPIELGMGWMLRRLDEDDRTFIGRRAIEREIAEKTSRWNTVGIRVDWEDWAHTHNERGLITPKDHHPQHGSMMLYDSNLAQVGYVPSFVFSPLLQRHIGIARVRPDHATTGTKVGLEVTIDHRYAVVESEVSPLPFFNPERKTA